MLLQVPVRGEQEHYQRLKAITDAALAHLDLDDLLDELLARIRDVLSVDTATILLLDPAGSDLVARASAGFAEEVERGVRIPLGKGFAGRVAAERSAILLEDVGHADVVNPLLREKGLATMLGVPLLVSGRTIGVLHVGTLTPREFDTADVDLLQLVADRAAIAIEHAKLFAAERRARLRLENVQAVTDVALAHLELDDAARRDRSCASGTSSDVDSAAVLLLERRRRDVRTASGGRGDDVVAPSGGGTLPDAAAERIAAGEGSLVLTDVDGQTSLLAVPLLVRDEMIGVLHVGTPNPGRSTRRTSSCSSSLPSALPSRSRRRGCTTTPSGSTSSS